MFNVDLVKMFNDNLDAAISAHPRSSTAQLVVQAERTTVAACKKLVRLISAGAVPETKVEETVAPTVEGNDPATLPELEALTDEESAELDILAAA